MNLPLALLLLAGSGIAVWSGLTDPEGGTMAGLRGAMTGEPVAKRGPGAASVAFLAAMAQAPTTGSVGTVPISAEAAGGRRAAVLATARTWLGVPYLWGGNTKRGVDCSGLTVAVYRAHGVQLPRVAAQQQTVGRSVPLRSAQPGDLVFWGTPAWHVGIYAGGGKVLHSPRPGRVVRYEAIWSASTVTVKDVLSTVPAGRTRGGASP